MHRPATRSLAGAVLALVLAGTGLAACSGDDNTDGNAAAPAAAGVIVPQPLAYPEFPVDSTTINQWVASADSAQARQHAWNLWAGLTAMTGQTANGDSLPVYETWLSRFEVYNPGSLTPQTLASQRQGVDRGFHSPVQFHHSALGVTGSGQDERVVAGVKYNMASALHVWNHRYTDSTTLDSLNNGWADTTAIANRNIVPFPDSAVAIKPTYWMVNQTGLTVMPYWAGPNASIADSMPTPTTWTQFVAIDPTNQQKPGDSVTVQMYGNTYRAPVIGLNQFYAFPLSQDEVNDILNPNNDPALDPIVQNDSITVIAGGQQSQQLVSVGDFGVLVGMHVATKEIGNWTWQTFWWTPNPAGDPLARDQTGNVQGPFRNFAMQQAYWMTVPNTSPPQNQVTFNPYLETAFADSGTVSNCMSCHRTATWPGAFDPGYMAFYGNVDPGNPAIFTNQTKLDFLWSVQAGASTAQAALQRRVRAASRAQPPGEGR